MFLFIFDFQKFLYVKINVWNPFLSFYPVIIIVAILKCVSFIYLFIYLFIIVFINSADIQ